MRSDGRAGKRPIGRPENGQDSVLAMNQLGNGLYLASHHQDALIVQEAELAMLRRLGASHATFSACRAILRTRHQMVGRLEESLSNPRRDIYSDWLRLFGEGNIGPTLRSGHQLQRVAVKMLYSASKEAKSVLRKMMPVARRVLGEGHETTLKMRAITRGALPGPRRHARRSPRGRDDARRHRTDRAARVWWRTSACAICGAPCD